MNYKVIEIEKQDIVLKIKCETMNKIDVKKMNKRVKIKFSGDISRYQNDDDMSIHMINFFTMPIKMCAIIKNKCVLSKNVSYDYNDYDYLVDFSKYFKNESMLLKKRAYKQFIEE